MNIKSQRVSLLLAVLCSMPLSAQEAESDTKIYMQAAMTRTALSQCLLVSKEQGKLAKEAYDDWLAPRKDAVARVAAQGCSQMCQMFGDPLLPLQKPHAMTSGPFALSKEEIAKVCQDGMQAASANQNALADTEKLPEK